MERSPRKHRSRPSVGRAVACGWGAEGGVTEAVGVWRAGRAKAISLAIPAGSHLSRSTDGLLNVPRTPRPHFKYTLQEMDPEGIHAEVRFLIDTFDRPDSGMAIAAGNGIVSGTPFENIDAFLDEALTYGAAHRKTFG